MKKQQNNQIYWIMGIIILAVIILPKLDTGLFSSQLPNPASVYCEEQSGESVITTCIDGRNGKGWYYWDEYFKIIELDSLCGEGSQTGFCLINGEYIDEWEFYNSRTCEDYGYFTTALPDMRDWEEIKADDLTCWYVVEEQKCYAYLTGTCQEVSCNWTQYTLYDTLEECQEAYKIEECLFTINEFCIKLWMLLSIIGGIILIILMRK